jgi:hypothetical protein
VQNSSNEILSLWLKAKEKHSPFNLPAGKMVEFGWAQGFRFNANDIFFVGGNGCDTIKKVMPSDDLSPLRLSFSNDGGLVLSASQSFFQYALQTLVKLPIKQNVSTILEIALNEVPQVILKEGTDRIYAKAILQATPFSGKVHIPITAYVSFIPIFNPSNGWIIASQTRVENIEMDVLPKEWIDVTTQVVNEILPRLYPELSVYQLDKATLKITRFTNVREVRVSNARLEIFIF